MEISAWVFMNYVVISSIKLCYKEVMRGNQVYFRPLCKCYSSLTVTYGG